MENKCCFIIPYFGKLPNTFSLFLKTCEYNVDFDWLILTDDESDFLFPNNVAVKYLSFEDFRKQVDEKMGFHVALNTPYKLCDFKPAYGLILEDDLKDYNFWGHCDTDILLGDLKTFITDDLLEKYDKLFCLGHMVLYRNSYDNNRVFMKNHNGHELYKKVFTNPDICWFDEEWKDTNNINQIFLVNGLNVYQEDVSLNFDIRFQHFRQTIFCPDVYNSHYKTEQYQKSLYYWNCGHIYRMRIENDRLVTSEFCYMHLQQRKMRLQKNVENTPLIRIVPNKIESLGKIPKSTAAFMLTRKYSICFYALKRWYKREVKDMIRRQIAKYHR